MKPGSVSRADVAAVCVAALTAEAAQNVIFELSTHKAEPPSALPDLFNGLKPGLYQ